jgi:hypothetical protein
VKLFKVEVETLGAETTLKLRCEANISTPMLFVKGK